MKASLGTILTAMVTPFAADGAVDHERLSTLAEHLLANGSDGLVVAGTTGESPTLTDAEKLAMFRTVVETVAGRATVVAGTGSNDTAHSVALTRAAGDCGVDGVLAVVPYYNKPPDRGVRAHFQAVAAATDLPVIIYNIPGRCVINVPPETLAQLGETANIVGVKQANPDLTETERLMELSDLAVYAGNDDMLCDVLACGGAGGICVASHLVGPRMAEVARLCREGHLEAARAEDAMLHGLYAALFVAANPIPVKAALNLLGHEVGGLRLPLVAAAPDEEAVVARELRRLGLLRI
ncbi:MAG: 4-hydroxy-tetrahydrodipicolinate synthase [Actinobacteria bacterium ADurb.BinA094]|nr:MAG: 4-hydroxy-tetrahydrodipicolinate synthase [Actinobacteria bacterium ADurb.BinA094]